MFIGHFGVGFGAKRAAPAVSLGTLFLAAQFVDLLWPTLLLLGVERVEIAPGITAVTPLDFVHYPWTHSLLMAGVWGLVVGGLYALVRKNTRGAVVLGLCVVSHWVLDLLVHRPDLPLVPGGVARWGLGLWNSPAGTLVVEGLVFAAGLVFYLRTTQATDRVGQYGFWGLVAFLLLVYVANLFGPAPTSPAAIAWAGHAQWVLVAWAYWIDRHRAVRQPFTS